MKANNFSLHSPRSATPGSRRCSPPPRRLELEGSRTADPRRRAGGGAGVPGVVVALQVSRDIQVQPGIILDFDENGNVAGVEVTRMSGALAVRDRRDAGIDRWAFFKRRWGDAEQLVGLGRIGILHVAVVQLG